MRTVAASTEEEHRRSLSSHNYGWGRQELLSTERRLSSFCLANGWWWGRVLFLIVFRRDTEQGGSHGLSALGDSYPDSSCYGYISGILNWVRTGLRIPNLTRVVIGSCTTNPTELKQFPRAKQHPWNPGLMGGCWNQQLSAHTHLATRWEVICTKERVFLKPTPQLPFPPYARCYFCRRLLFSMGWILK